MNPTDLSGMTVTVQHISGAAAPDSFWALLTNLPRTATTSPAHGSGTLVTQRFRHGPGRSLIGLRFDLDPHRRPDAVAWWSHPLHTDIRAVPLAADRVLSRDERQGC